MMNRKVVAKFVLKRWYDVAVSYRRPWEAGLFERTVLESFGRNKFVVSILCRSKWTAERYIGLEPGCVNQCCWLRSLLWHLKPELFGTHRYGHKCHRHCLQFTGGANLLLCGNCL